jgi:hypothetical protein
VSSGKGRRKKHKYLYFNQLLFLLPHTEGHATESNLSTQRRENKEDGNTSQEEGGREEDEEMPRNVRQKNKPKFPIRNHCCRFYERTK